MKPLFTYTAENFVEYWTDW